MIHAYAGESNAVYQAQNGLPVIGGSVNDNGTLKIQSKGTMEKISLLVQSDCKWLKKAQETKFKKPKSSR